MRAGALNRRIVVQQPVLSQSDTGEELITWTDFATVWARIKPVSTVRGGEGLVDGDIILAVLHTQINIRWSPNIDQMTEKWRLIHQRTVYDIVTLVHVEYRQREIELVCKSGETNG